MADNKRIAFVLGSLGRGGAERVISILSRDYAEQGWDVDILLLLFNKVEYELHPRVRVINLSGEGQSRIRRLPSWLGGIRRYIKGSRPDVVLSFAARINIIEQTACMGLGCKLYVSERNDPYSDGRSKLVDLATNILYPRADGVVFQTKRAASYFPKLKNGRIIKNPVSAARPASAVKNDKLVAVGRLSAQKNHKLLIDAFARIADKFPKYTLEIYGEGELEQTLKAQCRALGLEKRVLFMGNVVNLHERIADADVFVLSSDYEGLSNALMEAMMMGLPCVSTDCAGADEIICDGENGLLVPVGDEAAMAEALDRILGDTALRERLGACAASSSERFRRENILKQWHLLMDEGVGV